MAKLASAEEVIALIKSGKYASKVNAQRGAGRTRISKAEKEKVFAFIDSYFPDDGSAPAAAAKPVKVAKKKATRMGKKASKKVAAKADGAGKKKVTKRAKGHVTEVSQADGDPTEGTLPISPAQVSSCADILKLIDSTVIKSVSIMNALQKVKEFGTNEDVSEGVSNIKRALTGASGLLNDSVISTLTKGAAKADPEVTQRLEQVVAAAAPTNHVTEQPAQLPPQYLPPPVPENAVS